MAIRIPCSWPVILGVALLAGAARAGDPEWLPLTGIFDEAFGAEITTEMVRPFAWHRDELVSRPARVIAHPVLGPSPAFFPAGWTGGIDDPSGPLLASSLHSPALLTQFAHVQHVYRERSRRRSSTRDAPEAPLREPRP